MMLMDASFVIMMLLKCSFQHLGSSNYHIFHRPWMETKVRYDILLLENQIPFFILRDLYEASDLSNKLQGHSLVKITHTFIKVKLEFTGKRRSLGEAKFISSRTYS
ncbi:hypothetical protein M5689_018106 [Euphorbia peplus]|nr:hypothetical protein M5689_018106 [Euphorbia peplus]